MNSELESKILRRELGKLAGPIAGIGTRWAARRLPNVAHEMSAHAQISAEELFRASSSVLRELGKKHPDLLTADAPNETSAIVGSGIMNMNPTLVRVTVSEEVLYSLVHVHAVAKEGAIPQRSAELAVEKFMAALCARLPNNSLQARRP
jgi:hypothetical protein